MKDHIVGRLTKDQIDTVLDKMCEDVKCVTETDLHHVLCVQLHQLLANLGPGHPGLAAHHQPVAVAGQVPPTHL